MVKIQVTLEMKLHLMQKIPALTEKLNTFIPKIGENKILIIKGINIANVYTEKVISRGSEVELTSRHNNADT